MKNALLLESRLFTSLANPKRLEILHLLEHGSLSVSQIVEMTGIPQANISQHLSVLRRLSIVASQKHAQVRTYEITSAQVIQACTAMRAILLEKYGIKEIESLNHLHLRTDPVCGMEIVPQHAATSETHKHVRYYFCGHGCAQKFKKNPERYIEAQAAEQHHASLHQARNSHHVT